MLHLRIILVIIQAAHPQTDPRGSGLTDRPGAVDDGGDRGQGSGVSLQTLVGPLVEGRRSHSGDLTSSDTTGKTESHQVS